MVYAGNKYKLVQSYTKTQVGTVRRGFDILSNAASNPNTYGITILDNGLYIIVAYTDNSAELWQSTSYVDKGQQTEGDER